MHYLGVRAIRYHSWEILPHMPQKAENENKIHIRFMGLSTESVTFSSFISIRQLHILARTGFWWLGELNKNSLTAPTRDSTAPSGCSNVCPVAGFVTRCLSSATRLCCRTEQRYKWKSKRTFWKMLSNHSEQTIQAEVCWKVKTDSEID